MNRNQAFALLMLGAMFMVGRGSFSMDTPFFGAPNRAPVMNWHYEHLLDMIGLGEGEKEPEKEAPATEPVPEPEPEKDAKAAKVEEPKPAPKAKAKPRPRPKPAAAPTPEPAPPPRATIDQRAIDDLIRRKAEGLQTCYEFYGAVSHPRGGLAKVRLTINTAGKVIRASVTEDPFQSDRFRDCVALKFEDNTVNPPPTGEVVVNQPLQFTPDPDLWWPEPTEVPRRR